MATSLSLLDSWGRKAGGNIATGRSLLREPQAVPVASYHSSLSERRTGPCGPVGAALQRVLRAATSVDHELARLHHPGPSAGPLVEAKQPKARPAAGGRRHPHPRPGTV